MAQIKIEEIIDHLGSDLRYALEQAVLATIDDASFDPHELFRNFVRSVGRRCSTWERVPDKYVKE